MCARAGFGPVRIHDLRHTFASQAALQGHGLVAVSKMLGHRSLDMTMTYVHVHDPEAAQAAVKVATIICRMMAGKSVEPVPERMAGAVRAGGAACRHADCPPKTG